jgi:hypothetical protein
LVRVETPWHHILELPVLVFPKFEQQIESIDPLLPISLCFCAQDHVSLAEFKLEQERVIPIYFPLHKNWVNNQFVYLSKVYHLLLGIGLCTIFDDTLGDIQKEIPQLELIHVQQCALSCLLFEIPLYKNGPHL